MKKHTERPSIDELFSRKLGNMSIPPSANSFERLQSRMNQIETEPRLIFWHNPAMRPYIATAACLAIVCLFGWLYWPSASPQIQRQVAVNENAASKPQPGASEQKDDQSHAQIQQVTPLLAENRNESIDVAKKSGLNETGVKAVMNRLASGQKPAWKIPLPPLQQNAPLIAQAKPLDMKATLNQATAGAKPAEPIQKEQLAEVNVRPAVASERVLEVTIAEPQALVAARQEAKTIVEEKNRAAQTEKVEKESRGNLWQQMKRLKQGDLFARQDRLDDATNEDRGLLERAYSSLKQSLDKDKPTKQ